MSNVPRATIIDIHDQARDGKVSERIHTLRAEGFSVNEVAFRLREDGIHVDPRTLTRWLKRNEAPR